MAEGAAQFEVPQFTADAELAPGVALRASQGTKSKRLAGLLEVLVGLGLMVAGVALDKIFPPAILLGVLGIVFFADGLVKVTTGGP